MYPTKRLYKNGQDALLDSTPEAKVYKIKLDEAAKTFDDIWLQPKSAEAAAKKKGEYLWEGNVIKNFGQYAGKSIMWLVENDVGYINWLMGLN